jgi:hypothetical protein
LLLLLRRFCNCWTKLPFFKNSNTFQIEFPKIQKTKHKCEIGRGEKFKVSFWVRLGV